MGERDCRWEEQREKERISSWLPTECGASLRAQFYDPEIMTWAKTKSQTLNWLSHPGAPKIKDFLNQLVSFIYCTFLALVICGLNKQESGKWCNQKGCKPRKMLFDLGSLVWNGRFCDTWILWDANTHWLMAINGFRQDTACELNRWLDSQSAKWLYTHIC